MLSYNEGQEEIHIDIVDNAIGMSELEGAIKCLKKDKSAGEDLILNDFILNASHTVKILILIIFNNILTLEYFPSVWTVGSIVPIFKSGDKNNLNNYRGITILSCLGKLFTKILNRRLTAWAEQHNILDETQYGFRKHRSTVDCIFIIHGLIELLFSLNHNGSLSLLSLLYFGQSSKQCFSSSITLQMSHTLFTLSTFGLLHLPLSI